MLQEDKSNLNGTACEHYGNTMENVFITLCLPFQKPIDVYIEAPLPARLQVPPRCKTLQDRRCFCRCARRFGRLSEAQEVVAVHCLMQPSAIPSL